MSKKMHVVTAAMLVVVILAVSGCSKKSNTYSTEYKGEFIRINADESIMAVYAEDFDEKQYDEKELESMVNEEVEDFNSEHSKDSGMSVKSVGVKKDQAIVKLNFKTLDDYVLYNETYVDSDVKFDMFNGTYDEIQKKEYKLSDCKFKKVGDKKEEDLSISEILKKEDKSTLRVIYIKHGITIRVEGEIKYVSSDIKLKNGAAKTADGKDNYIIYTLEEEK